MVCLNERFISDKDRCVDDDMKPLDIECLRLVVNAASGSFAAGTSYQTLFLKAGLYRKKNRY